MTVRPPRDDEIPALRALQATLPERAPGLLDAAVESDAADLLIAVDGGTVVGYALFVPGPTLYLAELVVAPGHRGEGHGSALLSAVVERAGERPVRTVARATDERALSFYRSHGFTVTERLPNRFETGDGLLLRRS